MRKRFFSSFFSSSARSSTVIASAPPASPVWAPFQGSLPNRALVFELQQKFRRQPFPADSERRQDPARVRKGQLPAALEPVQLKASAGNVQGTLAALATVPLPLQGVAASQGVQLLLRSAGAPAAAEFLSALLARHQLPGGSMGCDAAAAPLGRALGRLLQHHANCAAAGEEGALEALVAAALEHLQMVQLPPSAVALVLQAAGRLGSGELLRELWAALARGSPTTGECNALLAAALRCGDQNMKDVALHALLRHGRVNGITLVTLFDSCSSQDEANPSCIFMSAFASPEPMPNNRFTRFWNLLGESQPGSGRIPPSRST